jgi:hypothetical protein
MDDDSPGSRIWRLHCGSSKDNHHVWYLLA